MNRIASRNPRARGWAFLLAAGLLAGCATSPPEPAEVLDVEEVTATVTALDLDDRLITLRGPQGNEATFEVGPQVRNLPQVKVGDRLTISYYTGLAAEVTEASPTDDLGEIELEGGRSRAGERPAGMVGANVSAVVAIEAVDKKLNTVTFRGADGLVRVVDVKRPQMQEFIKGLKKGDKVRVTYSEALAVEIRPAT
jgi:hypothetical protein